MSNQNFREAAQQALESLLSDGDGSLRKAVAVLRAALAQPDDQTDPGHDVSVLREHVRHLERQVRQLHAERLPQPDDKAQPVAYTTGVEWAQKPHWESEKVVKITRRAQPEHGFIYPLYAPPQPPAEQGAELSDEFLHKEVRLALGSVPAELYRNDLLKLMRKVIAADRAARGGAA